MFCDTLSLFPVSRREEAIDALHAATAIYTQPTVVDELLDAVDWPNGTRRLADPSCGDGSFLVQALKRLLDSEADAGAERILSIMEGWELHSGAASEARQRVLMLLRERGWGASTAASVAERLVRNVDFLTEGPKTPTFDVIAGNPPYLRFTGLHEILRDEYLAVLPAHACSDLLHSFLHGCAAALQPDGEIALVTADRWLFNVGASKLRESLGRQLAIDDLRRLDASSVFYRPKNRRKGSPPRIHPIAVVMRAPSANSIPLTAAPVFPDQLGPHAVSADGQSLGEIAQVSLAPWLGTPGIFVVDAATAQKLPPECLVPAIDTDDILPDNRLAVPKRYAIRTFPDREPPPAVLAHLDAHLHLMAKRGLRKTRWLPPESFHKRALDQPFLLVPRIARSLRPVRVPQGVLPVNHNLSIIAGDEATLARVEAVLNSEAANAWMRAHAPRLENGFHSLTTTLLRTLPMPA